MKMNISRGYQMILFCKGWAIGSIACTGKEDITIDVEDYNGFKFIRYIVNEQLIQFIIDDYKFEKIGRE